MLDDLKVLETEASIILRNTNFSLLCHAIKVDSPRQPLMIGIMVRIRRNSTALLEAEIATEDPDDCLMM